MFRIFGGRGFTVFPFFDTQITNISKHRGFTVILLYAESTSPIAINLHHATASNREVMVLFELSIRFISQALNLQYELIEALR